MKREVLPRQLLFVNEYVKDFNGPRAAEAAGYSKVAARDQAKSLLSNPKINARVEAIIEKRQATSEISRELLLEKLMDIATNSGNDQAKIRALELMGRAIGMFTENQQRSSNTRFTINLGGNSSIKYLESETVNALSIESEE